MPLATIPPPAQNNALSSGAPGDSIPISTPTPNVPNIPPFPSSDSRGSDSRGLSSVRRRTFDDPVQTDNIPISYDIETADECFVRMKKDLKMIFAMATGVPSIGPIENDTQYSELISRGRKFKKSAIIPTNPLLGEEVLRRAKNNHDSNSSAKIPKPTNRLGNKLIKWLTENFSLPDSDVEWLKFMIQSFFNKELSASASLSSPTSPRLDLNLVRLATILCSPSLRPLFLERNNSLNRAELDAPSRLHPQKYVDRASEDHNNQSLTLESVVFTKYHYLLEKQYTLSPPIAADFCDPDYIKSFLVNERAKISKVIVMLFSCVSLYILSF